MSRELAGASRKAMDSPRLLGRFRDSSRDHLARADALLMRLARDPAAPGATAELLRILHTIKGESRAMGLGAAADRAHEAEALLLAWRHESGAHSPLTEVARALADIEQHIASRVGALRLHSSGARALPARDAMPSFELGDVEIGATPERSLAPANLAAPEFEPPETVRVPLDKLEALANISGDLFLGQARAEDRSQRLDDLLGLARRQQQLAQSLRRALGPGARRGKAGGAPAHGAATDAVVAAEAVDDLLEMARSLRRSLVEAVRADREDSARERRAARELTERVRDLRLLPLSTLLDDCPRVVRDLALALGCEARVEIVGAELDVDRHVVEELRDPLLHLVQNAVDHGIEPPALRLAAGKPREGCIEIRASAEGGTLVLEVSDDGRGIDSAALRATAMAHGILDDERSLEFDDERILEFIFLPEFSSRTEVSEISGRGIGLDVVRDRVAHLKGTVSVDSRPGRGCRFTLRIPNALGLVPDPA